MAPQLAPEEPFVRQKGTAMRKDACYLQYVEALQCLDKHDYQQHMCEEWFRAFKACRSKQEEINNVSRLKTFESDPLLGWAFKLYNNWSEEQQANNTSSSSSSSSSSSDNATTEYQGWRPPPEDEQARQEGTSKEGSSSSDGSSSSTSSPLERDPLWGWAFRWYNSSKAGSSSSSST